MSSLLRSTILALVIGGGTLGTACSKGHPQTDDRSHEEANKHLPKEMTCGTRLRRQPVSPIQPDTTWRTVTGTHLATPIELQVPPELEDQLQELSPQQAILVIAPRGVSGATLQLGMDAIQGAADFTKALTSDQSTVTEPSESKQLLAGKPATLWCAELVEQVPRHMVAGGPDEGTHPAATVRSLVQSYYVELPNGVFRATYRIEQPLVDKWAPVFDAVLATLQWREPHAP